MTRSTAAAASTSALPQDSPAVQYTSTGRIKRWASQSVASLEDDEEDDLVGGRARGKRSKGPAAGAAGGASTSSSAGPSAKQSPAKPVQPGADKEERKMARMIRNRNAAQASRDRKKEHTHYLEQRVAQLEAQLNASGHPSAGGARSSGPRMDEHAYAAEALAHENSILRAQLIQKQEETTRLQSRLESLELNLARLNQVMSPLHSAATSIVGSPPPSSVTSPSFEPTFSFDNLPPLPPPSPTQPISVPIAPIAPLPVSAAPVMKGESSRLVAAEALHPFVIQRTETPGPFVAPDSANPAPALEAAAVEVKPSPVGLGEMSLDNVWGEYHSAPPKPFVGDIDDPTGSETSAEDEDWAGSMSSFLDFSFHDDDSQTEVLA